MPSPTVEQYVFTLIKTLLPGNANRTITRDQDLVTDLGRAYREGRLDRRLRIYLAPKVLIIDEMGYLPLDELGATIFFQLVSARYERGSIILTSNKSSAAFWILSSQ